MEQTLMNAGLSRLQAGAYLYLLECGTCPPKDLTNKLATTRSNTYKILESLEALGLVHRSVLNKKIIYTPADPSALSALLASKRNNILSLEKSVNEAMAGLRERYSRQGTSSVATLVGKQAMMDAYESQSQKGEPVYFIKARADIPFMGYDTMSHIRKKQAGAASRRYGITPDSAEAKRSANLNLDRTWIKETDYTAPVEWSVSGNELILQIFDGNGSVITINNPLIAESFRQIWNLTNIALQHNPTYKDMPLKAKSKKEDDTRKL